MAYQPISPQQSTAGLEPYVEMLPEVASSTWKAGAPVVRDANGFIAECGAAPTSVYGFAVNDGQNLASSGLKKCAVYRAHQNARFEGVLKMAALTQTVAGEAFRLVKGADGIWYADQANSGPMNIVGWSSKVKIGDTDPIVDMTVLAANIQEP
jgi:hypothetical protein